MSAKPADFQGMEVPSGKRMFISNFLTKLYSGIFIFSLKFGIPSLNLEDGIHPTAEGQKIVANNVWAILKTIVLPELGIEATNDTALEKVN